MNNLHEHRSRRKVPASLNASPLPKEKFVEHGGQAHLIEKQFFAVNRWVDFSASINPLGPSRDIEQVLERSRVSISRYPDPQSSELKQALSSFSGADADRIVVTNGATELIYLLPHLMNRGEEVLALVPVFSEYLKAFRLFDVPVQTLSYDIDAGFQPPMSSLIDSLNGNPKIGTVLLGHPNSPTGRLWSNEELSVIANYCEEKGKLLIVDETFIDFCPEGSSVGDRFGNLSNVISIRSMTKFFALPGVRLGFGVMAQKWVEIIEKFRPPWSVNCLAQELGLVSLKDEAYIDNSRTLIREQREFLLKHLSQMPWLKTYPSEANFILFRLRAGKKALAKRFYFQLLQEGILLRNCGNFEGLNENYFRIGVRSVDENKLLLRKINNFFSSWAYD
jgi:L-threonine-O-3-phosphate decarboxylase